MEQENPRKCVVLGNQHPEAPPSTQRPRPLWGLRISSNPARRPSLTSVSSALLDTKPPGQEPWLRKLAHASKILATLPPSPEQCKYHQPMSPSRPQKTPKFTSKQTWQLDTEGCTQCPLDHMGWPLLLSSALTPTLLALPTTHCQI